MSFITDGCKRIRRNCSVPREQRNWPRDVLESKDGKDAKRAYRQKCEGFITEDGLLFKTKRRKKGLTFVREEERYRVDTVDEKVRLLDTVHKDPAGGHFGVHKTYVVLYVVNWFHYIHVYPSISMHVKS